MILITTHGCDVYHERGRAVVVWEAREEGAIGVLGFGRPGVIAIWFFHDHIGRKIAFLFVARIFQSGEWISSGQEPSAISIGRSVSWSSAAPLSSPSFLQKQTRRVASQ
jgi:hypothetical protein